MALWGLCLASSIWEFPKIRGTLLWGPHIKDYCILGSILGSPHFGKLKDVYIDRGVHVRSSVGSRLIASGETVCCKPQPSRHCCFVNPEPGNFTDQDPRFASTVWLIHSPHTLPAALRLFDAISLPMLCAVCQSLFFVSRTFTQHCVYRFCKQTIFSLATLCKHV